MNDMKEHKWNIMGGDISEQHHALKIIGYKCVGRKCYKTFGPVSHSFVTFTIDSKYSEN